MVLYKGKGEQGCRILSAILELCGLQKKVLKVWPEENMKQLSFENTGKQNVCKLFVIYYCPRLKGENVTFHFIVIIIQFFIAHNLHSEKVNL